MAFCRNKQTIVFGIVLTWALALMLTSCNSFSGTYVPGVGLSNSNMRKISRLMKKADDYSKDTLANSFYKGSLHFSSGKARVKVNGKTGIVDIYNKFIIPAEYDSLGRFWNGWSLALKDGQTALIAPNGSLFEKQIPHDFLYCDLYSDIFVPVIMDPESHSLHLDVPGASHIQSDFEYGQEDYNGQKVPVLLLSETNYFSEKYYFINDRFEGEDRSIILHNSGLTDFWRLAEDNSIVSATANQGSQKIFLIPDRRNSLSGLAFTVRESFDELYLQDVFNYSDRIAYVGGVQDGYYFMLSNRWSFLSPGQTPEWVSNVPFSCTGKTIKYGETIYTVDDEPKYGLAFFDNLLYSLNYNKFKRFFDEAKDRITYGIWKCKDSSGNSELAFWGDGTRGTWEMDTYNPGLPSFGISGGYIRSGNSLKVQFTEDLSYDTWSITYMPVYSNLYGEYNVYLKGAINTNGQVYSKYL